jgi:hypothetical protein
MRHHLLSLAVAMAMLAGCRDCTGGSADSGREEDAWEEENDGQDGEDCCDWAEAIDDGPDTSEDVGPGEEGGDGDASGTTSAPSVIWARTAGGERADEGRDILCERSGNAVAVGSYFGNAFLFKRTLEAGEWGDAWAAAFDRDGALRWNWVGGGRQWDTAEAICPSGEDRYRIVGGFMRDANFPRNRGESARLSSSGWADWYTVELEESGAVSAVHGDGNAVAAEVGKDCIRMTDGGWMVGYHFYGWKYWPQPIQLRRYDRSGSHVSHWKVGVSKIAMDESSKLWLEGLALDNSGMLGIVGYFMHTAYFPRGDGTEEFLSSPWDTAGFVALYTVESMQLVWVLGTQKSGTQKSGDASVRSLAFLGDGSVAVCGRYVGRPLRLGAFEIENAGAWDGFLARIDPRGEVMWLKGFGGAGSDACMDVAVLPDVGIVLTGYAEGPISFQDSEGGAFTLAGRGKRDILVAAYTLEGRPVWARLDGGTGQDTGLALAVCPDRRVVLTGWFDDEVVFNAGSREELRFRSHGSRDIFAASLGVE